MGGTFQIWILSEGIVLFRSLVECTDSKLPGNQGCPGRVGTRLRISRFPFVRQEPRREEANLLFLPVLFFLSSGSECVNSARGDVRDDDINKRNIFPVSRGVCTVTAALLSKDTRAQALSNSWPPHPEGIDLISF